MSEIKTILQRIKKVEEDQFIIASKYYNILSIVNNLGLTGREIELITFAAIKGNISYKHLREEFCETYGTTTYTVNNIVSRLKKIFVLIKEGGKIKVNPALVLDFNSNLTLEISLLHAEA